MDDSAYSDGASLPDVHETSPVTPSEWTFLGFFGRQLFREAVVQLLAANLAHAGQKGQIKGGLLRRAKRLVTARDLEHCCEAIQPTLHRQGPNNLRGLLREHHKLVCHDFLENDEAHDLRWRAQQGHEQQRTVTNARRLLRRSTRHLHYKSRRYLEWAAAKLLRTEPGGLHLQNAGSGAPKPAYSVSDSTADTGLRLRDRGGDQPAQ